MSCLEQSCLCIYCDHFYGIVNSIIMQKDSPNGYRRRKLIPKCLNGSCERRLLNRTNSIPKAYSILKKILCILHLLLNSFVSCETTSKKERQVEKLNVACSLLEIFRFPSHFLSKGIQCCMKKVETSSLHQNYLSRAIPRSYRVLACPSIEHH